MSANASTAAADMSVRSRKTSKKATYRADLLQEPDKDSHQHVAEANEFESQLMDVGKRLIAVSHTHVKYDHRHPQGGHTITRRLPQGRGKTFILPHPFPTDAGMKGQVCDCIFPARREASPEPWPRPSLRPWTAPRLSSRPTRV